MRRLLIVLALFAFAAGTTLSVGCGEKTETPNNTENTDSNGGDENAEENGEGGDESASLNTSGVALTTVSFDVKGMS